MKTKLIILLFALLSSTGTCIASDGNGLPIDVEPSSGNQIPHRSLIFGVFNTITQTLTLTANTDDAVEEVYIYKDGVLIVSDQEPMVTIYDLSFFGTGTYQVEVITESGTTYCGCFTY